MNELVTDNWNYSADDRLDTIGIGIEVDICLADTNVFVAYADYFVMMDNAATLAFDFALERELRLDGSDFGGAPADVVVDIGIMIQQLGSPRSTQIPLLLNDAMQGREKQNIQY